MIAPSAKISPMVFALLLLGFAGIPQVLYAGGPSHAALDQFDRYVQLTEERMASELLPGGAFLRLAGLPPEIRSREAELLRNGDVLTERLETRDGDSEIGTPGALIHHWIGAIFIPKATLGQVLAVVQDYNRQQRYYAPQVLKSQLISRNGDEFKVYLRLAQTDILTVAFDTEHDVRYARVDETHAYSRAFSTRVAEIEHAGEPSERALPPGKDHGLLWRIDSFWRFEQREGGVYVQCEAISLTRDIPLGLGPLVGPFLETIPKQSLEFTLRATRAAVISAATSH
jgi:hypothetical protein